MAVDAGQHLGQPAPLRIAQLGGGADVRHHFAAARNRKFSKVDHRVVGALTAQQFDGLRKQLGRRGTHPGATLEHIAQQLDAPGRRVRSSR